MTAPGCLFLLRSHDDASHYRDWWLKIARRCQEGGPLVLRQDRAGPRRLLRRTPRRGRDLARDGQVLADDLGYHLRLKSSSAWHEMDIWATRLAIRTAVRVYVEVAVSDRLAAIAIRRPRA